MTTRCAGFEAPLAFQPNSGGSGLHGAGVSVGFHRDIASQVPGPSPNGFTILEVAIALVVLVLGLVPLAGVMAVSNNLRTDSEGSFRLHLLCANRVERLKGEARTVTELMARYPNGSGSFAISIADLRGLAVTEAQGYITVSPLNLGVSSSVELEVGVNYLDSSRRSRVERVATRVDMEGP